MRFQCASANSTCISMSIDTGCSGSLVAVDAACRYISSGDTNTAIVAAANLFLRYGEPIKFLKYIKQAFQLLYLTI